MRGPKGGGGGNKETPPHTLPKQRESREDGRKAEITNFLMNATRKNGNKENIFYGKKVGMHAIS